MRAALYARVSSPEQLEGYSIDAQKRAFKLLCRGRGWEPVAEYIDEGKSARSDRLAKRPAFRKAWTTPRLTFLMSWLSTSWTGSAAI